MFDFFERSRRGSLPHYSFLDPRYFWSKGYVVERLATDQHPSHEMAEGDRLIKEVYESLRASPTWNSTMFMVTYDEHGGFYDHVSPPTAPNPDNLNSTDPPFDFRRLGVRIPVVVASPWIPKGTIVHTPPVGYYDHSSVYATLRKLFDIEGSAPFLTNRDASAASFEHVLSSASPRTDCPTTLPDPPKLAKRRRGGNTEISELQESFLWTVAGALGIAPPIEPMDEATAGEYILREMSRLVGWNVSTGEAPAE